MATIKRYRLWAAWGGVNPPAIGKWEDALLSIAGSPAYLKGLQDGRDILEYQYGIACWLEVEMEPPLKPYQRWRHPPGCPDADWCSGNGVCHWDCQGSDDTCL